MLKFTNKDTSSSIPSVNFAHISQLSLVLHLLTLSMYLFDGVNLINVNNCITRMTPMVFAWCFFC